MTMESPTKVNELCPYCEGLISDLDLREVFEEMHYSSFFNFDCPHCGEDIDVEVVPVPTFSLSRK